MRAAPTFIKEDIMQGSISAHSTRDRIVLSLAIAVIMAALGSAIYYAFFNDHTDPVPYPSGIPSWAWGATNITLSDSYLTQPTDFSKLKERSDVVVMGVISQVHSPAWATPGNEGPENGIAPEHLIGDVPAYQIRTPVQFDVKETFKGDVPDSIQFSFMGGRVGDVALITDESKNVYTKDAALIVFLSEGDKGGPSSHVNSEGRLWPRGYLTVLDEDTARGPVREVALKDVLEQLR